MKKISNSRILF